MIPDTISKDHIILAIREIDEKGYPQINESTTYFIRYNDKKYPAKYTISLANKFVDGKPLSLHDFSGGSETNDFLKSRGFEIVSVSQEKSELKSMDREIDKEVNFDLSKSSIFISSSTERNLRVSKDHGILGWEFNSKSLSKNSLIFIYNTNKRNIETCFQIDKKIGATNQIWPDEIESKKIIYEHRWTAKIIADRINLSLESLYAIETFDKKKFLELLDSNFPIPLNALNKEKYSIFQKIFLDTVQKYSELKDEFQKYWIFVVTDHKESHLTAEQIYLTRMDDKFWGLNENTPYRKALKKGDRVIFSRGAQEFLGTAQLDSNQFNLNKEQQEKLGHNNDFFKSDYGIFLKDIEIWKKPKEVKPLLDGLSFVKDKNNYYIYFQGGIKKISESEYAMINSSDYQKKLQSKTTFESIDPPLPMPSLDQLKVAIDKIKEKILIDEGIIRQIVSSLLSGKHVLLAGPIGTGKTHLASMISEFVWKDYDGGYYPEVYTATSVWTTQDVIGGIYPKLVGDEKIIYDVQKGCVTDTVSKNWQIKDSKMVRSAYKDHKGNSFRGVWLIIDEFNRANIDSAFGEMITSLEYGNLKIPTNTRGVNFDNLPIPKDFRIIGTLNTFDKHYLFKLSDALKRRFAFIEINPPRSTNEDKIEEEKYYVLKRSVEGLDHISGLKEKILLLDDNHAIDRQKTDPSILNLLDAAYEMFRFIRQTKNLGTAILISIFRYVLVDSMFVNYLEGKEKLDTSLDKAFTSYIIPQLEGRSKWALESIRSFCCEQISEFFKNQNTQNIEFRNYENEFKKLLKFLGKGDIEKKIERYRHNEIKTPEDWETYNPWLNKQKPRLPLFRQSLLEMIEESEII